MSCEPIEERIEDHLFREGFHLKWKHPRPKRIMSNFVGRDFTWSEIIQAQKEWCKIFSGGISPEVKSVQDRKEKHESNKMMLLDNSSWLDNRYVYKFLAYICFN